MTVSRAAVRVFASLLRLYPGRFREEFGPEIAEVFAESVRQAERQGALPALAVGVRELVDFPVNLIVEYWEEMRMQKLQLAQPVLRPVWWGAIGFGLAAALAGLFHTALYVPNQGALEEFAEHWRFWGEFLAYAVMGGLGGFFFALVSRQPAKAKLFWIAGSMGFLIGHLLWYPVMVGSSVALFYADATDAVFLFGLYFVWWIDIALMMSLTGLFIGGMEKNPRLAGKLFVHGVLGAAIGGILGLCFAGLWALFGLSVTGRGALIFVVNALAGIFGGALLGRAILREGSSRDAPATAG
jgi:hypothetical protein